MAQCAHGAELIDSCGPCHDLAAAEGHRTAEGYKHAHDEPHGHDGDGRRIGGCGECPACDNCGYDGPERKQDAYPGEDCPKCGGELVG